MRQMVPMESKRSEAQFPGTIVTESSVIDRRSLPHKEQRQQASETQGLKEEGEKV